ncbi:UbiD family decarboxylase [Dissulfurirhabdus thermomarina]|uniref:UbiD family decarboxylase n=1 Tax=Dissulfurirhabdus thermomarina TaxID=1765737 RepID=A0A6N9TK69_DISTH|nr:UbiD family decarboxylase [Dissulfurirhabdus thermomarina]NDY41645.1 UbiD family decarboxylase [Dissulfurirhabdus thermomarina]NMX24337.1 UbiD family decarboxylase [Dissulfurirhabdus thermomarina]
MGYRNLAECIHDLEARGDLVRVREPVDPDLEAAAIQRRVFRAGGPALLFTRVKGCRFPLLANLFGTMERTRYLFRDTLEDLERAAALLARPAEALRSPGRALSLLPAALRMWPRIVPNGPVLAHRAGLLDLPRLRCWPGDGGAFVTLPQVYSESPARPGLRGSNLGMYRIQITGGRYRPGLEAGLHYQIHRGIGVHHAEALERGVPLRVNVFVGGPPCLAVAAVMPLPEGVPEIAFAGLLGGRRLRLVRRPGELPVPAEADFCISGTVEPGRTLPEGPFGDHLGYYSLVHEFPVLRVERVTHRPGAVWPFTTVGRPPQEDTHLGALVHELTAPAIPRVIPGVKAVHAVDAAGVHPLLLAVGSERYVPYAERRGPMEILTQANAILGTGQLSLAKFLLIAAREDDPDLDPRDVAAFFRHVLERVDWRRDLHFQTRTTVDTLDYTGTGLHRGSKVVIAAAGPKRRKLPEAVPARLPLPVGFRSPAACLPGVAAVTGPPCRHWRPGRDPEMERLAAALAAGHPLRSFALVVVADDSAAAARSLDDFLWTTFTRADPAGDVYGAGAFTRAKHWGCEGPLVIDARRKPHHAPPLEEDPAVIRRIEALAAPGRSLHGILDVEA